MTTNLLNIFGNTFRPSFATKEEKPIRREYPRIIAVHPTGSRFICNPPVMDTDDDKIALVDFIPDYRFLEEEGWTKCGEKEYAGYSEFQAFRKAEKNVMFTTSRPFYLRHIAAAVLARELNLIDKKDRVALFQDVQYGSDEYRGPFPDKGFL